MKEILLNVESKEIRLVHIVDNRISSLIIERKNNKKITGNIYCGYVKSVLENIQSVFVDIGENTNGFVHISDVVENRQKLQDTFDMDFEWKDDQKEKSNKKNVELLKEGQKTLVQVLKEPIGNKGIKLTSSMSLPGRYLILLPNNPYRGISKKITSKEVRSALEDTIELLDIPKHIGIIFRTSCMDVSKPILIKEAAHLMKAWKEIIHKFEAAKHSICLYKENNTIKNAIISALDKGYTNFIVDHYPTYLMCNKLLRQYKDNEHILQVQFHKDKVSLFNKYKVEQEIEKAIAKKIWLHSGGYIFLEQTEAMYTIDVNSGRSNSDSSQDIQETLVQINMEAAEELARQISIRNIGGLIVCDFIDMDTKKGQKRVLDKLRESMNKYSAKCTILGMSRFGIVEMTRQRIREPLVDTLFMDCPYCNGIGKIRNFPTSSIHIIKTIRHFVKQKNLKNIKVKLHPLLKEYFDKNEKPVLQKTISKSNAKIEFVSDDRIHIKDCEFFCDNKQLEV